MGGSKSLFRVRLALAGAVLFACATGSAAGAEKAVFDQRAAETAAKRRLYLLSFDRHGELLTPLEQELAVLQLTQQPAERLVILSYGWNNDRETSYENYQQLLAGYERWVEDARGSPVDWSATAIIAVGWDAQLTAFRKLSNDLIPLPRLADSLALVPDLALVPVSYWSKAAMADRIGFGGLRRALNEILGRAYEQTGHAPPRLHLIAHSFGTRLLSALVKDKVGSSDVEAERFVGLPWVRSALMIQPAALELNLHRAAEHPVVVTQSRHDHANGFLFPIANLPWNAYTFTAIEGFLGRRVFGRGPLRRALSELISAPLAIAWSLGVAPVNYAYAQSYALYDHPVDHVMDTLAQIPVVEIPVWGLSEMLDRDVNWGDRDKGFLNLGPIHESAARTTNPVIGDWSRPPVHDLDAVLDLPSGDEGSGSGDGCGLPSCRGLVFVDVSDKLRHGIYAEANLRNAAVDFSLGWLDPIGAHNDYRQPAIYRLLDRVLRVP